MEEATVSEQVPEDPKPTDDAPVRRHQLYEGDDEQLTDDFQPTPNGDPEEAPPSWKGSGPRPNEMS